MTDPITEKAKYTCSFCGHGTNTLSLGEIAYGCLKCGERGFADHMTPELNVLHKHLYTSPRP